MTPDLKNDSVATTSVDTAIADAKRTAASTMPQRAPELVAHQARISRKTAHQGKLP